MRAILTWHSLDDSGSVISTAPDQFARQVQWLADGGVQVVPLDALVRGDVDAGRDAVALTFDDGFANVATVAAPRLEARGWPYTVFVVSRSAGADNCWPRGADAGIPVLPLLDWDALARLQAAGATLGAHTRTHRALVDVPADALAAELAGSADDIAARTGVRPSAFAYPYGARDAASTAAVAGTFAVGVTTRFRALGEGDAPSCLPRLDMYYFREPRQLHRWGSLAFRSHLRLRGSMRQVRQLLPR